MAVIESYLTVFVAPLILSYVVAHVLNIDYTIVMYAKSLLKEDDATMMSVLVNNIKIDLVIILSFYLEFGVLARVLMFVNAVFVGSAIAPLHKRLGNGFLYTLVFSNGVIELGALSLVYYASHTKNLSILAIAGVLTVIAAFAEVNFTAPLAERFISKDKLEAFKEEYSCLSEEGVK